VSIEAVAAGVFALVAAGVVLFQLALAAGAPWGAYAMGGAFPGRYPPGLRLLAVVQGAVIALLALVVLSHAGLATPTVADAAPWAVWVVVLFSIVAVVLNAISRSAGERRIWVPVSLAMLVTAAIVALA
jgi:phosphoglycerol transferase MdoB-like AlkP superfamily enzyme